MGKYLVLILVACAAAQAHDIITTPITWDREVSRIVYERCASCHHTGGAAFSLMTYADARPWAVDIKEEVLGHLMPPWGAVKGFADYRNDQGLTPEQVELIVKWADGGVPEGDAKDLPKEPKLDEAPALLPPAGAVAVSGEFTMRQPLLLDGLLPKAVPEGANFQVTAELPDGSIQPLVWFEDYKPKFGHPFLLRTPLELPAGAKIHGVPAGATLLLLPAEPATTKVSATAAP